METSCIIGACLGLAGFLNICQGGVYQRYAGLLLAVAGITEMGKEWGPVFAMLLATIGLTAWILSATGTPAKKQPSK